MKQILLTLTTLIVTLGFFGTQQGRVNAQDPPSERGGMGDPIRQLNLTAEQREQIRIITSENREERMAINQRAREANRALDEVLDSDSPDEATVEQRLKDVAAAQAAQVRMRVLTEMRIRRVLTPEQLQTLRQLRQQAREMRRDGMVNQPNRRDRMQNNQRLPNQRNGLGPLLQRRDPRRP